MSIVKLSSVSCERLEELEEDLPGGLLGPAPYDRRELKEKGTDSERVTNWDIAYGTDTLHPGRKGVRFVKTEARSARDFKQLHSSHITPSCLFNSTSITFFSIFTTLCLYNRFYNNYNS